MKTEINLDAYFERIGYEGPHTASLDTFQKIHELHPQRIAFENLNPFLGIPVRLDPESLQRKLIFSRRGGYCFEHNLLFKQVLESLGFTVRGLAARVLWNRPEDTITARGHMLLLVGVEEKSWIADVGFGGQTLTAPLLLEPGIEQQTPHELYRLMQFDNGDYKLQTFVRDEWRTMYRFDFQEQYLQDYDVTSWYLSNHPESHFVTGLIAARSAEGRRYALRNNELSIHHLGDDTEKQSFNTVAELRTMLEKTFLLDVPPGDEADDSLQQLVTPGGVLE